FIKVKDTNFENKSQHIKTKVVKAKSLLINSKIQFLKANHNGMVTVSSIGVVVYQCQRYNF
ncbi:MAG: hypothetical protein KA206_09255, partial [Paludibacter sp.]|nr:hypothetical protein [Paludibacter sp.]